MTDCPHNRRLGFTGTRDLISAPQRTSLREYMTARDASGLFHGRCVGADEAAHDIALDLGWWIEVFPGINPPHLIAPCQGADRYHEPQPNLVRNGEIIRVCNELLACPNGPETRRSGTWSTIRKARGLRPITIFWPDGTRTFEPALYIDDLV